VEVVAGIAHDSDPKNAYYYPDIVVNLVVNLVVIGVVFGKKTDLDHPDTVVNHVVANHVEARVACSHFQNSSDHNLEVVARSLLDKRAILSSCRENQPETVSLREPERPAEAIAYLLFYDVLVYFFLFVCNFRLLSSAKLCIS
jgi:hypothetical protein